MKKENEERVVTSRLVVYWEASNCEMHLNFKYGSGKKSLILFK